MSTADDDDNDDIYSDEQQQQQNDFSTSNDTKIKKFAPKPGGGGLRRFGHESALLSTSYRHTKNPTNNTNLQVTPINEKIRAASLTTPEKSGWQDNNNNSNGDDDDDTSGDDEEKETRVFFDCSSSTDGSYLEDDDMSHDDDVALSSYRGKKMSTNNNNNNNNNNIDDTDDDDANAAYAATVSKKRKESTKVRRKSIKNRRKLDFLKTQDDPHYRNMKTLKDQMAKRSASYSDYSNDSNYTNSDTSIEDELAMSLDSNWHDQQMMKHGLITNANNNNKWKKTTTTNRDASRTDPNNHPTKDDNHVANNHNNNFLAKSTCSFMILSKVDCIPFLLAILIFIIQLWIYGFALCTIFDDYSDNNHHHNNPFDFPHNVPSQVRFMQLVAITFTTLIIRDDLRTAFALLSKGYDGNHLQKAATHTTAAAAVARYSFGNINNTLKGVNNNTTRQKKKSRKRPIRNGRKNDNITSRSPDSIMIDDGNAQNSSFQNNNTTSSNIIINNNNNIEVSDVLFRMNYIEPKKWKWSGSIFAMLLQGLLAIMLTTFFVIKSSTNEDMFSIVLYFSVVSKLDYIFFYLSKKGHIGILNQKMSKIIVDMNYSSTNTGENSNNNNNNVKSDSTKNGRSVAAAAGGGGGKHTRSYRRRRKEARNNTGDIANFITQQVVEDKKKKKGEVIIISSYASRFICFGFMIIMWMIVVRKQLDGHYFCSTINVQFGDDYITSLGTFSGLYDRVIDNRPFFIKIISNERIRYVEKKLPSRQNNIRDEIIAAAPPAIFAYCDEIQSWTFTYLYQLDGKTSIMNRNPCHIWSLRSSRIISKASNHYQQYYDLVVPQNGNDDDDDNIYAAPLQWYLRDKEVNQNMVKQLLSPRTTTDKKISFDGDDDRKIILQYLSLFCYDCDNAVGKDEDTSDKVCSNRGKCFDAVCICDPGVYGSRCEFDNNICSKVENDDEGISSHPIFSSDDDEESNKIDELFLSTLSYQILRVSPQNGDGIVTVYNKPVYVNEYQNNTFEILLFTGRRWIMTLSTSFTDVPNISTISFQQQHNIDTRLELESYLINDFHAYWSNYDIYYISEPIDNINDDDPTAATPTSIRWYKNNEQHYDAIGGDNIDAINKIKFNTILGSVSTNLLCTVCNNITNPCLYGGICNSNHECECVRNTKGMLCEIAPLGDGHCDPYFNTGEFMYDHGDCCESTCQSSNKYTCGKYDIEGYVDIGYSTCAQFDYDTWYRGGNPILNGDNMMNSDDNVATMAASATVPAPIQSGYSVALSGNGQIIAIGEPGNNRFRLLDKNGKDWIERTRVNSVAEATSSKTGNHHLRFGSLLASSDGIVSMVNNPLSKAALIVAVGTTASNEKYRAIRATAAVPNTYYDSVTIYDCQNECNIIGNDIIIDNDLLALDVSGDGKVVLVGAVNVVERTIAFNIYKHDKASDRLVGKGIIGPLNNTIADTVLSVSLSFTGDTLAIQYDVDTFPFTSTMVYKWNGSYNKFMQHGTRLELLDKNALVNVVISSNDDLANRKKRILPQQQEALSSQGDQFLSSVSISDDGTILAMVVFGRRSSSSHYNSEVKVYEFSKKENDWKLKGKPITTVSLLANDSSINNSSMIQNRTTVINNVHMSMDGAMIAFEEVINNGRNNKIHTFKWNINENIYEPIIRRNNKTGSSTYSNISNRDSEEIIEAAEPIMSSLSMGNIATADSSITITKESSMSLSRDGTALAVGLPYAGDGEEGITVIYEYNHAPKCSKSSTSSLLRVSLKTNNKPEFITWSIMKKEDSGNSKTNKGNIILSGGPYDDFPHSTFVEEMCIHLDTECIIFSLKDPSRSMSSQQGDDMADVTLFLDGEVHKYWEAVDNTEKIYHIGNCKH